MQELSRKCDLRVTLHGHFVCEAFGNRFDVHVLRCDDVSSLTSLNPRLALNADSKMFTPILTSFEKEFFACDATDGGHLLLCRTESME